MKYFVAIIGTAMLALGAFAQGADSVYSPQTLFANVTVTAATATNVASVIDCRKQATVTLQITCSNTIAGAGAGAGSAFLYYQRSVDASTYETALSSVAFPTPNGLTANTFTTNLSTYGCGFIKIPYATNAMQASTNLVITAAQYAIKIRSP